MHPINTQQLESLKKIIEKEFTVEGQSFNTPYVMESIGINFVVLERYSYNFKLLYVIVPLKIEEQFDRLNDLESITRNMCIKKEANFAYFGTCTFIGNEAKYLTPTDYQIENLDEVILK